MQKLPFSQKLSIVSNFIPNETVTTDDRNLPWINNKTKSSIKNKTEYFKNCVKPNNPVSKRYFGQMQNVLQKIVKFFCAKVLFQTC